MSEDCNPTFAPLMDGNYAEWEICREADLVDKGLWEYVFTKVVKPARGMQNSNCIHDIDFQHKTGVGIYS